MSRARVLEWKEAILDNCAKYGVPPSLVAAVMEQESHGEHYWPDGRLKVSNMGAIGLMQLLPSTAQGLGVDPTDQQQNIQGGVRYLAAQWQRFHDFTWVAAAYNAGPGAVLEYQGVPPYAETQTYVTMVSRYLLGYLDLDMELIWGAPREHAPATGTYYESYSTTLGVANLRRDLVLEAIAVLEKAK